MASVDFTAKGHEGKLINFLRETLQVDNKVINCFVHEKINESNVKLLTDNQLKELGITALGDRVLLRDSFSNSEKTEVSREEKLEKIRMAVEVAGAARRSKRTKEEAEDEDEDDDEDEDEDAPLTKKTKRSEKETLKFQFEWKHWDGKEYVRKKLQQGGGCRQFDVPRNASLDECKEIALDFFFPDGESDEGSQTSMRFELANFKGDELEDPFIASEYKRSSGLIIPRIYLLSEKVEGKGGFMDLLFRMLFMMISDAYRSWNTGSTRDSEVGANAEDPSPPVQGD